MTDVFLVSAARTPIGSFGGALKAQKPGELAAHVAKAVIARGGIDHKLVGTLCRATSSILGCATLMLPEARRWRRAARNRSRPIPSTASVGQNFRRSLARPSRLCSGDCEIPIGAGVEIVSRAPYFAPSVRWDWKMGVATLLAGLTGTLTDPSHRYHMGVTAENIATRHRITRNEQDALALESQRRAAPSMPTTCPMTIRSARPARLSRRTSLSRSEYRVRSSIWGHEGL